MLHFNSCPKCTSGTVEHNYDTHGEYLQCLNCGFMRDVSKGITGKQIERLLSTWRRELKVAELAAVDTAA